MNELTKIAATRLAHPTPEFRAALHDLLELDLECFGPPNLTRVKLRIGVSV